jgi:Leucine-rich repeat (LRR) protein
MRRLLALTVLLLAATAGRADPPTAEQLQGWIRDLDSPAFRTRDQAARQLRLAGPDAAPALAKAAKTGTAEVADRALRLLGDMAEGPDPKAEAAARRQLRRLAEGESRAAADARSILNRKRDRLLAGFMLAGGSFRDGPDGLEDLYLDSAENLDDILPALKFFPELPHLSASNRGFGNAQARFLADLPNLAEINLYRSNIGDEGLKHLAGLKNLRRIPMGETKVTDAGLKVISGMTQLEYVGVRGNNVTDAGLVHLKGLTNLTGLYLGETKVTDAGLKHLSGLTRLQTLYLDTTAVTDEGLELLKELKDLRYLTLKKTRTTEAGRARLKEALPDVRITDVE